MTTLSIGFNAITWTGEATRILDLPQVDLIDRIFGLNVLQAGYVGYQRGGKYPTLTTLRPNTDYLVYATAAFALETAVANPTAFPSFPGYTAPVPTTPGATAAAPSNLIVSATAAESIIVGRLVGRVTDGVVMYDADDLDHRQRLLGIALNSASAGGTVNVQQRGTVLIPGLGLGQAGDVLHARTNGQMGLTSDDMAFQHIVGRTLTPDSFFLSSQSTYSL